MEIKRFLDELASGTPTPGGGSASALAGALSASLVMMVEGLSGKKAHAGQRGMEKIRKRTAIIQKRLFKAIEEDARSFDEVMRAFRLPKNSEKERLLRKKKIQKAYQKATITPQLVCRCAIELLEYSKFLIMKGNPNAVSDAGVAAFLADAALAGGLINIGINLMPVSEKAFLKRMNSLGKDLSRKRNRLMQGIEKALEKRLS